MLLLALETSTLTGSAALLETERTDPFHVRGEITLSVSAQHSEQLVPVIKRLLEDSDTPPLCKGGQGGVDLLAVSTGPGSFTGLRIGIATAQGLAAAFEKPVIGVSTLEALAVNGSFFHGLIVPLLDARRGEVYGAAYRSGPETVIEERAADPRSFLEGLPRGVLLYFLGPGAVTYRGLISEVVGDLASFAPASLNDPRAANVGLLAWQKYRSSERAGEGADTLQPRYLRPAETTFKGIHGLSRI